MSITLLTLVHARCQEGRQSISLMRKRIQVCARSEYHTQLQKMGSDKIFDLTGVCAKNNLQYFRWKLSRPVTFYSPATNQRSLPCTFLCRTYVNIEQYLLLNCLFHRAVTSYKVIHISIAQCLHLFSCLLIVIARR